MPTKGFVFGDDGSTGADTAWRWICNQSWPEWTARVVTSVPPAIPGELSSPGADHPCSWMPEKPRTAPQSAALKSIEHLKAEADPREVLEEIEDASLIVVGGRGEGALKALGLGSTADYLITRAPAPLVIASDDRAVARVLFCADGSPDSMVAAEALSAMPWLSGVIVTALTVNPELGHDLEAVERAVEMLERGGARVGRASAEGKVTHAIRAEIDRSNPDLVALGTKSLTGFRRVWLGSTAGSIARHAECPVLIAYKP